MRDDDLLGKVCVVTGASSGIGKEIARGLALKRATVVMASRDRERGEDAVEDVSDDTANPAVTFLKVDLASQRSTRAFASELMARHPKIDVLVNNAGVWLAERQVTEDGVEATWATNVLGYFLLTQLLLPQLAAASPARVVNVASKYAFGLDLADVEFRRRPYDGRAAYAQSKQADRMITWGLADRLRGTGITANAMHPGMVATALARDLRGITGAFMRAGWSVFGASPRRAADTAVWAASSAGLVDTSGSFFVKRKEVRCPFRDEAKVQELWDLCEQMTAPSRLG